MRNSYLVSNLSRIKSSLAPTEESINNQVLSEQLQIERLQIELERKKQEIIKVAEKAILNAQKHYFEDEVIPNEVATMSFIDSSVRDFLDLYSCGKADLEDSVLYYNRSNPIFKNIEAPYPRNISWILEYIASNKNRAIAAVPGLFIRSRLTGILLEMGISDVLVERTWSSELQEWYEEDQGSLEVGHWYTTTITHYEIMLIKKEEFDALSKFDKSKKYQIIQPSLRS